MNTDRRYNEVFKEKIIAMRKQGLSYGEISKSSGISKSTLSTWLRDIKLKPAYQKRFYTQRIKNLTFGIQSQRERRRREVEAIIEKAKKEVVLPFSKQTFMLAGAFLYWAEGSKGRNLEITNSDPHLILFAVLWFAKFFGVSSKNLRARLNIYPQQNESKIKRFWSDITGIPIKNFGKSYIKPLSTGYKKNNLYYGTVRIEVPKGTDKVHKVFAWVNASLSELAPHIAKTQRKWNLLERTKRPVNLK